jgi:hypothetical protein
MTDLEMDTGRKSIREVLLEIKVKAYNPALAAEADRIAAENRAKWGPFDIEAYEAFIKDHPIFSKMHLYVDDYVNDDFGDDDEEVSEDAIQKEDA